jgi:opacity protein-like surface antigen
MKFVSVGACAAVAFCASSAAWAGDYYVSGALGGVFRPPYTTTTSEPTDASDNRLFVGGQPVPFVQREHTDFDPGTEVDGALGRRFSLGVHGDLRAEAEFSFRDYQVGTTTVTAVPGAPFTVTSPASIKTTSGVHEQRFAETANIFYDFTELKGFTPYLGAGVGYQEGVQTSGERVRTAQNGTVSTLHTASSSSDDGTWLAEAGVAVPLTSRLSLAPAYRFSQSFAANKPANLMRVALRYSF